MLVFSNNGGSTYTDAKGDYLRAVNYGWTGTVTPEKGGYVFSPTHRSYQNVESDFVNHDYVAYTVTLSLEAERKIERAWILRRDYGEISVQVQNPGNITVSKFILYRRENNGAYTAINEILGSELQNSFYYYTDKFLDRDRSYTYRMTALASGGAILAISNEQKI
jgi:hypothetical protein